MESILRLKVGGLFVGTDIGLILSRLGLLEQV
jgi:hypothetical protein